MSGHHPISELFDRFSPEEKQEIEAETNKLREEMTLQELRKSLGIEQGELGEILGIKQAAISRMERRNDILLSSLRKAVEAMGGELVVIARFKDTEVCLNNG
jgi:DNA-binding XRE family transcriptional regulator